MSNDISWNTPAIVVVFVALAGLQVYLIRALFDERDDVEFEVRRLYLGVGVLFFLGSVLLFSIAVYIWDPSGTAGAGKTVFDSCIKIIPPIITLILGYYFGSQNAASPASAEEVATEAAEPQQTAADDAATIRKFEQQYASDPSYAPVQDEEQGAQRVIWR